MTHHPMTMLRGLSGLLLAAALALGGAATAAAQGHDDIEGCPALISQAAPRIVAAALKRQELALQFVGHATFLIETAGGIRAATDYNDYVRPSVVPEIATMNRAHTTHYTNNPDPGIRHVLRGWNPAGGRPASHDVTVGDMRVRNVVTNIRDWSGGTRYGENSIFVFEAAEICIAHLGHLHHTLEKEELRRLGRIDVLLVPVDGSYTLDLDGMFEVIANIGAPLVIPMHYFNSVTLARFLERAKRTHEVERNGSPRVLLSRETLPTRPKVLVLPGR